MGIFILKRDFSKIRYEFASLLQTKDRISIRRQIREDISLIVKFDLEMQPVSPEAEKMRHMMYMINIIDEFTLGQTSIIKINTKTLEAVELYKSDFVIVHLQIKENEMMKVKKEQ